MDLSFLKSKDFVKKFLIINLIICSGGILFDLLGFLQVPVIQAISSVLVILSYAVLLLLAQLVFINADGKEKSGNRVKLLAHGLVILLAFTPLLMGLLGLLSSMMIYFIIPVNADGTILGVALTVILMLLTLGYGIILSVYCYNNLEGSEMWNF